MAEKNNLHEEFSMKELVISRVISATPPMVFKAWSDADGLAQWWGAPGFILSVPRMDFRPGGMFLYSLRSATAPDFWGRCIYQDIMAPKRIVFISSFSDVSGNITRDPFNESWPLELLNAVTLEEAKGKTLITFRVKPYNATEREQKTFEEGFASVQNGFVGTFDQLEAYLDRLLH